MKKLGDVDDISAIIHTDQDTGNICADWSADTNEGKDKTVQILRWSRFDNI